MITSPRRISAALRGWLPSRRPSWAMMPRANAGWLLDTLLTAVSVLERAGVAYTAHQGTLLGAARLGGLLPWDIDADIAICGEDAESVMAKLSGPLAEHALALIFSPEHYYFTIRPAAWPFPLVEVILVTQSTDASTGDIWHDRHSPHRMFAPGELMPLRRYPFHGAYIYGPARADCVLERLYGSAGNRGALARFAPAAIDDETRAFWSAARPLDGAPDFPAIAARSSRLRGRWIEFATSVPWYLANGVYNSLTESVRRMAGGR